MKGLKLWVRVQKDDSPLYIFDSAFEERRGCKRVSDSLVDSSNGVMILIENPDADAG